LYSGDDETLVTILPAGAPDNEAAREDDKVCWELSPLFTFLEVIDLPSPLTTVLLTVELPTSPLALSVLFGDEDGDDDDDVDALVLVSPSGVVPLLLLPLLKGRGGAGTELLLLLFLFVEL
jgi:hypothetical protein